MSVTTGDSLGAATLQLEDAILCADTARVAGLLLSTPLDIRDATFWPVLSRVDRVLEDYPEDVAAAQALARALASTSAADAAVELGEPAFAMVDQRVLSLGLSDRMPAWISDLIWNLGEEVSDLTDHRLLSIETLCLEWDLPRPSSRVYLFALAGALGAADDAAGGDALPQLLAADPGMCNLVPDLLAQPGVGAVLTRGSWARGIAAACRDGLLDRQAVLDLALMQRPGDQPEHLRWFVSLHDELDPTNEEMLARTDAYLRLLEDPRPVVVAAVLEGLRHRDAGVPLPVELVLQCTERVFGRDDELAPAHIDWLRSVALRDPHNAGRLALALTDGYASTDEQVVEHSLAAVLALFDVADIDTLDEIAPSVLQASAALPTRLSERALRALGAVGAAPKASEHPSEQPSRPRHGEGTTRGRKPVSILPGQVPGPARSLERLLGSATEFLVDLDPQLGEIVLDGVAALAGADLEGTRQALQPLAPVLAEAAEAAQGRDAAGWLGERPVLTVLARLVLANDHPVQSVNMRVPAGPAGVLTMRAQEVLSRASAGQVQQLLSRPTEPTGAIAPQSLLERIAAQAAAGGSAWPMDAEQALLRAHGTYVDPDVIRALGQINSSLARSAATRLRQSVLNRPAIKVHVADGTPELRSSVLVDDSHGPLTRHAMDMSSVSVPRPGYAIITLMAMPHHRELAAAHLVGPLSGVARRHLADDLRALALLGSTQGRTGAATATAVLFGACLATPSEREAAAIALTGLAENVFDSDGWASAWAGAIRGLPGLDLNPLAETLTVVARRPAGARLVWVLVQAVLEALGQEYRPGRDQLQELQRLAAGMGQQRRARLETSDHDGSTVLSLI